MFGAEFKMESRSRATENATRHKVREASRERSKNSDGKSFSILVRCRRCPSSANHFPRLSSENSEWEAPHQSITNWSIKFYLHYASYWLFIRLSITSSLSIFSFVFNKNSVGTCSSVVSSRWCKSAQRWTCPWVCKVFEWANPFPSIPGAINRLTVDWHLIFCLLCGLV